MNRFFTLLLAAFCLTAFGQVTYPYNPDGNADNAIGVSDIQDLLTVYGSPFSPSEITVGDSTLTYWVEQLSQIVHTQQQEIDSLSELIAGQSQDDFRCGEPVEFEGQSYSTVLVGGRCWFAENVRWLPEVFPPSDASLNESRYYVYEYTGSSVLEALANENYQTFGVYYNRYAFAHDTLCPSGWHLPTIYEWRDLLYATSHPDYGSTPEFHGCRDLLHEDYDWDFSYCPSDCGLITNGTGLSIRAHGSVFQYPDYFGTGGNVVAYFGAVEPDGHLYFYGNQIYLNSGWQNGKSYPARCIKDAE